MNFRPHFSSVRNRFIFWFLVISLIPLFGVSLIIYGQRTRDIKEEAFRKLTAIREMKVNQISAWLADKKGDLMVLSQAPKIKGMEFLFNKQGRNREEGTTIREIREYLQSVKTSFNDYKTFFIINPVSGRIEISTKDDMEGRDFSGEPYLKKVLQGREIMVQDIHFSPFSDKPVLALAAPVYCLTHQGKHVAGILVAYIDLEKSLYRWLQDRTGMGESGETLIVNKQLLALNELRWFEKAPLRLKMKGFAAVLASQGNTGVVEARDYRGKMVLAAHTYIPEMGWGFVAKQDLEEVYKPVNNLLWNILGLSVGVGILIGLLAAILARSLSLPIREMAGVAQKIEGGDFSARNVVLKNDELGYLAGKFNQLTDTLTNRLKVESGVSELIGTMVSANSLAVFFESLLMKLMEITGSPMGAVYSQRLDQKIFEPLFSLGMNSQTLVTFDGQALEGQFGKVLVTRTIHHLQEIPSDSFFTFKTFAGTILPREMITIPLITDQDTRAVALLARLDAYDPESLKILNLVWPIINTAYNHHLANEENRRLNEELGSMNQELQAQSEELQSQAEELRSQAEELQEQNQQLEIQNEQIQEANRLKSQFLSNMSHELRTPLNSILALSSVLRQEARARLAEEEQGYFDIIRRNGETLLGLINDILDLAKIETGKMEVAPKDFSLGSAIESVVERLLPIAEAKGLELTAQIPPSLPYIQSEEARVHQILQNLISNAVKFTEQGKVTVSVRREGENFKVQVADTGIGIDRKDLSIIFEEFRQVDGSYSRKYEGTGLGLAIAKKATELLGGEISVTSETGKGSTFTVCLPASWTGPISRSGSMTFQTRIREVGSGEEWPQYPMKSSPTGQPVSGSGRLLLAEDNEVAVLQVKKFLENEGYAVDVVRNGREALAYLQQNIPAGIILDLMMPEMNGFEVLAEIRTAKRTSGIPVLVLSAKELTSEDREKLKGNNIHQFIQKGDIDRLGFLERLRAMLEKAPKTGEPSPAREESQPDDVGRRGKTHRDIIKPGEKPKVLVVDDSQDQVVVMEAILRDRYELIKARDGGEALMKIRSDPMALVLLDMALPGLEGAEVVRKIRKEETRSIPVIAVTAQAMKGDRERFLAAGCDDYLSKPFESEALLTIIKKWIREG